MVDDTDGCNGFFTLVLWNSNVDSSVTLMGVDNELISISVSCIEAEHDVRLT